MENKEAIVAQPKISSKAIIAGTIQACPTKSFVTGKGYSHSLESTRRLARWLLLVSSERIGDGPQALQHAPPQRYSLLLFLFCQFPSVHAISIE